MSTLFFGGTNRVSDCGTLALSCRENRCGLYYGAGHGEKLACPIRVEHMSSKEPIRSVTCGCFAPEANSLVVNTRLPAGAPTPKEWSLRRLIAPRPPC